MNGRRSVAIRLTWRRSMLAETQWQTNATPKRRVPKWRHSLALAADEEACENQVAALMSAWNKASAEARQEFLDRIDTPIMDGRFK
jgi:hypothetical protein